MGNGCCQMAQSALGDRDKVKEQLRMIYRTGQMPSFCDLETTFLAILVRPDMLRLKDLMIHGANAEEYSSAL